jgi:hypothetical protein
MSGFEKQVAAELTARISASGLHVGYLDCPPWRGHVPARMSCRGYVDGLVSAVFVRLSGMTGRAVRLDAWLADGLVATRNLETTVRRLGWATADCGRVAAYPATVGSRIICRVTRSRRTSFVVATVRSRSGDVVVSAYGAAR